MPYSALPLEMLALHKLLKAGHDGRGLNAQMQQEVRAWRMLEGSYRVTSVGVEVERRDGLPATEEEWGWGCGKVAPYMEGGMCHIGEGVRITSYTNPDGETNWTVESDTSFIFDLCLRGDSFMDSSSHLPPSGLKVFVTECVAAGAVQRTEWLRWRRPGREEVVWSEDTNVLMVDRRGDLVWVSRVPALHPGGQELVVTWRYQARRVGL